MVESARAPSNSPEGPLASPALAADPDSALRGTLAGRFLLPADEVQSLQQRHGLTAAQLLTALIPEAAALARPPISNFHVGFAKFRPFPPDSYVMGTIVRSSLTSGRGFNRTAQRLAEQLQLLSQAH